MEDQNVIQLKVKTLDHFKGELPSYASAHSSGFDIRAQIDQPVLIKSFERVLIPTGLVFEIPKDFELQIRPRSGLALKKGLTLINTPGTIDSDYRGELKIILVNLGREDVLINDKDRIAQAVVGPVYKAQFKVVAQLEKSQRGEGGFGSTGYK